MKVVLKVRFGTTKEKFEKFSENNYLVYVPLEQDNDSAKVLEGIISKKLGVPSNRVVFAGLDMNKNWVFEVM